MHEAKTQHTQVHRINLRKNYRQSVFIAVFILLWAFLVYVAVDELLSKIFAKYLMPLFSILLIGYLHRLEFNPDISEIKVHRGLFIPFITDTYSFKYVRRITLKETTIKTSNDKNKAVFTIHLSGIKDAVVAKYSDLFYARKMAEKISRVLKKPMNNYVYKKSSIRQFNELDMSLLKRHLDSNESTVSRPEDLQSSNLKIDRGENHFKVIIRNNMASTLSAIGIFFSINIIMACVLFIFANVDDNLLFNLMILIFGFLITLWGFLSVIGSSKLSIYRNKVIYRQGYSPISFSLKIDSIEEYIVTDDGIHLVSDKRTLRVGFTELRVESDYLEKVIMYELYRLGY